MYVQFAFLELCPFKSTWGVNVQNRILKNNLRHTTAYQYLYTKLNSNGILLWWITQITFNIHLKPCALQSLSLSCITLEVTFSNASAKTLVHDIQFSLFHNIRPSSFYSGLSLVYYIIFAVVIFIHKVKYSSQKHSCERTIELFLRDSRKGSANPF